MKKQLCTLFLLLVLVIQVLPIQQMGRMLFSNQFTEEIPHNFNLDDDLGKIILFKTDYTPYTNLLTGNGYFFISTEFAHFSDIVPQNFSHEIHVPPPNCLIA